MRPGLWEMAQIHYVGYLTNDCLFISGNISTLPGCTLWAGDGCFICKWCHYLLRYRTLDAWHFMSYLQLRPFLCFCFSVLLIKIIIQIIFVLLIPLPKKIPPVDGSPILRPLQYLQLCFFKVHADSSTSEMGANLYTLVWIHTLQYTSVIENEDGK